MRIKRLVNGRHSKRNWLAFGIFLLLLVIAIYFLAVAVEELFLILLAVAWVSWWVRG